jgi:hypothetical protein
MITIWHNLKKCDSFKGKGSFVSEINVTSNQKLVNIKLKFNVMFDINYNIKTKERNERISKTKEYEGEDKKG